VQEKIDLLYLLSMETATKLKEFKYEPIYVTHETASNEELAKLNAEYKKLINTHPGFEFHINGDIVTVFSYDVPFSITVIEGLQNELRVRDLTLFCIWQRFVRDPFNEKVEKWFEDMKTLEKEMLELAELIAKYNTGDLTINWISVVTGREINLTKPKKANSQ
jgi:hypothetical protein